jgi:alpha-ribazole phosphatase
MKRLYLVRHGAVEGGEGRAVGHVDLPISSAGRGAMEALAASWRGPAPDRLFASDLRRATESARILSARLGIAPEVDPRLRELSFGDWDGLSWDEIHRRDSRRMADWGERWWELSPPGGETFDDLSRRVLAWFHELEGAGVVVAVAHGGSLRALLAALLDLPRGEIFELRLDCSRVSALHREGGNWVPLSINQPRFF